MDGEVDGGMRASLSAMGKESVLRFKVSLADSGTHV